MQYACDRDDREGKHGQRRFARPQFKRNPDHKWNADEYQGVVLPRRGKKTTEDNSADQKQTEKRKALQYNPSSTSKCLRSRRPQKETGSHENRASHVAEPPR